MERCEELAGVLGAGLEGDTRVVGQTAEGRLRAWPPGTPLQLTEMRKTLTPWSSASTAVIRMPFSLALSSCICAHSLVLRMSRRLPWVRITAGDTTP